MSNKPIAICYSPVATRSGYGEMARGFIRNIIDLDRYDLKLISCNWGGTPLTALDGNDPNDQKIIRHIGNPPFELARQPEVYIHIGIPNELQPVGKTNIIFTAGIETNLISQQWIEFCNKADAIFAISQHSANVIRDTKVEIKDQAGNITSTQVVTKPIEVLHCPLNTNVYKKISSSEIPESVNDIMFRVKEKFNFLFVGHWLKGNVGEDRKNVGLLVKLFCETFKKFPAATRPGLILKTSGAGFSILDREEILKKIDTIKDSCGKNTPNVYLVHGNLTEQEMNGLYNHPKVKVHISLTKGEGAGLPLLEATQSEKPVMASGWSGQLDFLNPDDAILLGGELKQIDPSAVWDNILIKESSWFSPDPQFTANAMLYIFKNYDKFLPGAKKLALDNAKRFNNDVIKARTIELLDKYIPKYEVAQQVPLILPTLKRL